MDYIYNLNTHYNRPSNTFKYLVYEANLWISFSHYFTRVVNLTDTQIK